ncbi:MAG: dinitrogenase iron-molybdenum cofactor [Oceanospirillaceae bacterium]|nr:dinitrogenase iron-molybdenum cofactor [Oceanospirillaceae bacterium]MBT14124.1 dinitrogenase iron-molybdenum cofactor [Oceanospirillaceae bacterium]|tara:strand:- start:32686 stop:33156 length:471 start_codon:yes stop_codon:yes gene_type:complete
MTALNCVAEAPADNNALLVAFASMDGDMVDQHFGSAQAFYLYSITADKAEQISSQRFGQEKMDGNEDKLKPKLAWLNGADIVYCGSIGGSATRQLMALGITPVKVSGGPDVEELIEALQQQLNGTPEFWLAKIMKNKTADTSDSRFDAMEEEGWEG